MNKPLPRRVGGPAWKPGDPTLTVSELAEALAPIAPDIAGTVQRIRHWTREQILLPVDLHHAGSGKHRRYAADAAYDAAILHTLTAFGLPVAGSRTLVDGLTKARMAVQKWKAGQIKIPILRIWVTAKPSMPGTLGPAIASGVYEEGEEVKSIAGFKVADVVLKMELNLGKLFDSVRQS
jgi:DNA-binding transcriptional MerR regulator